MVAKLRYLALRPMTILTTSYEVGDIVDTAGMEAHTIAGLVRSGWLGTSLAGDVGRISVSDEAPEEPKENDLWIDTLDSAGGGSGRAVRATGNLTLSATTAWTNVDTGLDVVVPASANDLLQIGVSFWGSVGEGGDTNYFDMATIVSGSVVNYVGGATDPSSGFGLSGWRFEGTRPNNVGPPVTYLVVEGDVEDGSVRLRLRYRMAGTGNTSTFVANAEAPAHAWVVNLG